MMPRAADPIARAENLRVFQRAVRDEVSMDEARRRIAQDQEALYQQRIAARANACGTAAPAIPSDQMPAAEAQGEPQRPVQ
ncbi:hypothetical protein ACX0GZ_04300 [Sphingomonas aestuarii]